MKKIKGSIFVKIWFGISALLIGYTFSMMQVQFGAKRMEHDLLKLSSVFIPSSVFSQKAITGFTNQANLYENAFEEGEPGLIQKAYLKSNDVRTALNNIARLNKSSRVRSMFINDLIKSFETYTLNAQKIYSILASDEFEKIHKTFKDSIGKLAFKQNELLYQLSELENIFSKDLQIEMDSTLSFLKYQQQANVLVFLSVLLISLFSMWLITRRTIVLPIQDIIERLKDVGRKGVNDFKLPVIDTWDEIGQLNTAFNKMMSEITQSHDKINNYAKQLEKDIIKRKKTEQNLQKAYDELSKTQQQLVQSGKLASIGELAAGVAHELNQPLMVIRATAQISLKRLGKNKTEPDRIMEQMKTIEKNTKRMNNIINHLRTFSRQSPIEFAPIDINRIIDDSLLMTEEQLRIKNITIKKNTPDNLQDCFGDPNQVEQVFLNLITNARDAILEKEEQCKAGKIDYAGQLEIIGSVPDNNKNYVAVLFKDNGCGIPLDITDKIFDPFYTTKMVGKGTGLGLSISYGIVKKHKGSIEIVETSDQGTSIKVLIPIGKTMFK